MLNIVILRFNCCLEYFFTTTDTAILLTYILRKQGVITFKTCARGCACALMFSQAHVLPGSSVHANPYIFVPTRACGVAVCVDTHIFLIIVYGNLQAEINRCRNYLGTEIN